jgi:hypothetical protein
VLTDTGADQPFWRPAGGRADPDEIVRRFRAGDLWFGVRHQATEETWEVRLWLDNQGDATVTLGDAELLILPRPAPISPGVESIIGRPDSADAIRRPSPSFGAVPGRPSAAGAARAPVSSAGTALWRSSPTDHGPDPEAESVAWVWPAAAHGLIGWAWEDTVLGLRVRQGELTAFPPAWPVAGEARPGALRPITGARPDTARSSGGEPWTDAVRPVVREAWPDPARMIADEARPSAAQRGPVAGWRWLAGGRRLAPGERTVLALSGRLYRSWAEIGGLLPPWLPPLALGPGQVLELDQPDAAVTVMGGTADERPERIELRDDGPVAVGGEAADERLGRIEVSGDGPVTVVVAQGVKRLELALACAADPARVEDELGRRLAAELPDADVAAGLLLAAAGLEGTAWPGPRRRLAVRGMARLAELAGAASARADQGRVGLAGVDSAGVDSVMVDRAGADRARVGSARAGLAGVASARVGRVGAGQAPVTPARVDQAGSDQQTGRVRGATDRAGADRSAVPAAVGEVGWLLAGLGLAGRAVVRRGGPRVVAAAGSTRAGLGLACAHLWRATSWAGGDLGPLRRLMGEVERHCPAGDWLARLEWDLVTGRAPEPAALSRLMLLLGAGLPGQMAGDVAQVATNSTGLARAVAVAAVVPETQTLPGDWPTGLRQAAQLARWRVLADFGADRLAPLVWLALSQL